MSQNGRCAERIVEMASLVKQPGDFSSTFALHLELIKLQMRAWRGSVPPDSEDRIPNPAEIQ